MTVILAALAGVVVQIGYVSFMKDARTVLASAKLGAVPNDTVLLALLPVRPPGFDAELFE